MPLGGRPKTSAVVIPALKMVVDVMRGDLTQPGLPNTYEVDVHMMHWMRGYWASWARNYEEDGGVKPDLLNKSLRAYMLSHPEPPDYWVCMDDDVVLSVGTLQSIFTVLDADEDIYLAGAWNEVSEFGRGNSVMVGGQDVQYGENFCVGGAVHVFPQRAIGALSAAGGVYPDVVREEDVLVTNAVRRLGKKAVLVRSAPVAIMANDGVYPAYYDFILALHYAGYDPRRQGKWNPA
jgi:hypothetical protein